MRNEDCLGIFLASAVITQPSPPRSSVEFAQLHVYFFIFVNFTFIHFLSPLQAIV